MVPGLAERDWPIADAQWRTWLAEARDGLAPRSLPHATPSLGALWRLHVTPLPMALTACLRRVARAQLAPSLAR